MSLYKKYRPKKLEDMVGNESVIAAFTTMLEKEERPHAFLFTGPTGCGKTTLARIISKELGAKKGDFVELDSASYRGIDDIRDIRRNSQYIPTEGKCRVWLCDEIHMLTSAAQNAFLKILEDTPPHIYFILCTTDPQKLLPTLRGRCTKADMSLLSNKEMNVLLKRVVKGEGDTLEKEVYKQIIADGEGHPRNALQILEQVLNVEPELRLKTAQQAEILQTKSIELCEALLKDHKWAAVAIILKGLKGEQAEGIRRHVLGYMQAVLLNRPNHKAMVIMENFLEPFFDSGHPQLVAACYNIVEG